MEFHKKMNIKKRPEIITKKKITPKMHIFSSHSQSNIPTIKQFNIENQSLTEKNALYKNKADIKNENNILIENVKKKVNKKTDRNDLINNIPSSLVINLRPKYQIKRPVKKYNKIKNPNPLKQFEYQQQIQSLHSSQKSIPNSIIVNANRISSNNSKEKNNYNSSIGISPLYIHRSANNINNINNNNKIELEIEINGEEKKYPKIRYHRPRKNNSPLFTYNNSDNEEIIYNLPYTDEDSIGKNNFNSNQYFDTYEINEEMDPVQNKVLNKKYKNDNLLYGNPFLYSSDEAIEDNGKFEENTKNIDSRKPLVRKFTDIYDPKKNKNGILLQKTKMTVPLTEGTLFDEKDRNCSKNSKLSDLIMNKKKYSPDPMSLGYEDFYSGSEDKTTCQNEPKIRNLKTFNRRSFEKFTKNRKSLNLGKSPEERFKNFSLAMISSKGKNSENRPILRKMRFEKGGVVDLAPEDGRKKRFKYLIKKMNRSPGKQLIHNNPKYREKAAELIQDWWFSIKEFRKKRIKSAILIQSCFRGRFTRKYLYDVIFMNYLYFGFCKKIEKFIKKKYGPYFINCLFKRFINKKKLLNKLINNYKNQILKYYLNNWKINTKNDNQKKLALLYLLRIRAIRESKMFNLKRVFSKWSYITIIEKERSDIKDFKNKEYNYNLKEEKEKINLRIDKIKNDNMKKIKGLMKIINYSDKFIKKKSIEFINPKIKEYMKEIIKNNNLKKLLEIREKNDLHIIKKYFYIFYNKCFYKEKKENKIKKIFNENNFDYHSLNDKLENMKKQINLLKKMKMELFILKLEPYLSSKKELYKLFLNSILFELDKLNNILYKLKNKRKESFDEDYEIKEEYKKKKKIKKIKEESELSVSEKEKEKNDKRSKIFRKENRNKKKILKDDINDEEENEEVEYEESEDTTNNINIKKKENNIKKIYKEKKKDKNSNDLDESKEEKDKKVNQKKRNKKDRKRSSSFPEEEEEIEEEKGKRIKKEKEEKSRKNINKKDRIKLDIINNKENDEEISSDDKEYNKKKENKKRKYRRKINEKEMESEEEEEEEINEERKKGIEKRRSSSLDKISEKSKELSENNKEYSLSEESKKKEKIRANSEKEKGIKKKEFKKINDKKSINKNEKIQEKIKNKESEDEIDEIINKDNRNNKKNDENKGKEYIMNKKEKKKKAIKKKEEKDSEDNEESEEISEKDIEIKNKKQYIKDNNNNSKRNYKNEEIDDVNRKRQINGFRKKTDKEYEQIYDINIKKNIKNMNYQKKYILKNILKIKKSKNEELLRKYLNIWKLNKNIYKIINKNNDLVLKKYGAKIIYIFINNLSKKLINKKLNKWRRAINNKIISDNSLKMTKKIQKFIDIIKINIIKKYFRVFIQILKESFNQNNKFLINLVKNREEKENKILFFTLFYWNKITKLLNQKHLGKNDINIHKRGDKNKFKILIDRKIEKDNLDILENVFNIWKNDANNYIDKLIIIQNAFKQILVKKKLENIKKLKNELINIFKNREKCENSIKIFNLRKWNMISRKFSCINKINLIQKYFRKYLSKKENSKYKSFFNNIHKYKLINSINEIAKYNLLKRAIRNISKNRIISKIFEKIRNNNIMKILEKIVKKIDDKNKNSKMKYYLNKWNNRIKYIKNKDNKKLKVLLLRIFDKKDNLKNLLKSYFLRWKRIHNLLSIINSVIKIQNNWRKKKSLDNYNKKKDSNKNLINIFKIFEKTYKKNNYDLFISKLKDKYKKYLLNKMNNGFIFNRNNNLKYVMNEIRLYIKKKYLYKIVKIAKNGKIKIIENYFHEWKNKTNNENKIFSYLNNFIEKKEIKNNNIIIYTLLKWLYHSKLSIMKEKVICIQRNIRKIKKRKDSGKNWENLKNKLYKRKIKKEIKNIIKNLEIYKTLDKLNNNIKYKAKKSILKDLNNYNKKSLGVKIIKKLLIKINENKSSKNLKKYFMIWKENINKEIEREEKLNDLLYVIEKRMNINSANYLYYVSLLKNIFEGVIKLRKLENFKKLREFAERNRNMNNLSKSLSLAYNDLKGKKQKKIVNKILKYFIYHKLSKLFEEIKERKLKELKINKALFITYLKKKVESGLSSLSDNSKKKRNSFPSKIIFKPKQKTGMKYMNKEKNKSQGIIKVNTIKNETKKMNGKEKEKMNGKDKIRKNIVVKGGINKSKSKAHIIVKNNKESIRDKSEEESENENGNIKENINYLYINIEKIIKKRKKETLFVFKEKIYKEKKEREKEEEKIFYIKKLYKTLKNLTIRKLLIEKEEISRAKKLINLIKLTTINSQISTDRWIRQLIRRWRFISFVKNVSKKKLELMYKNLHVGYLEIINSLFNNENKFPSMIKEFENFGADVGMYKNSDYYMNREKELYQRVKKKYISKPIEYDRENSLKIESGKFINELKYKSDEGEDMDFLVSDSDKDILNKQKARISNNYDHDK